MCRLRIAGGQMSASQLRAVARLAGDYAGGYAHVTTRANLQIRDIAAQNPPHILTGLSEAGLTSRGAGADNIRNITGSPTAGIDAQELIDTQPLCREMHHYILNHRELYGLPRKFNIAFDGGGRVSCVDDTNDIGFYAVRMGEGQAAPAGVYFRMRLGGITGHQDFAVDEGVLLRPDECVKVADAVLKVFIEHGDRTDRKKARMKYVLDKIGHGRYLELVEEKLGRKLLRIALADCAPRPAVAKHGHVDFHAQKQAGLYYVGVALPVGKLTVAQMHGLADIADHYGSGSIRLTVWQNLLISDIPQDDIGAVKAGIEALGLAWQASSIRAGLISCTGNQGCKFSAADTKRHALEIADFVEPRITLDQPINIHLTGCHHSCAQHYIGDIGLIAAKVDVDGSDDQVEGYHLLVGGGYGAEQALAREVFRNVRATDVPALVERMLAKYLEQRSDPAESFQSFSQRQPVEALAALWSA
jgi:ferredoxin-nitrite reductase